jgi:hypothetical protein
LRRASPKKELEMQKQNAVIVSQLQSRFMSLPGEVRNLIYEYCVEDPNVSPNSDSFSRPYNGPPAYTEDYNCEQRYGGTEPGIYLQPTSTRVDYHSIVPLDMFKAYAYPRDFCALTQVC